MASTGGFESDPFQNKDFANVSTGFDGDPFAGEDPFKGGKSTT